MSDKVKNSQAMLVSFSGIDGAGKSTQIENLRTCLREADFGTELITFWDDVARLKWIREGIGYKLFKGDKGVGTPETPIHRRDKNVRSPLMTVFRLVLYFVDAISLSKIARNALRSQTDVVIFDRYIYDELANLNSGNTAARLYVRGIMKLVPRPEISFVLDAEPAQARARKPEYPLEFLRSNRDSYLRLNKLLGGITVIPPMPLDDAKAEVVRHVLRMTHARACRSDGADHAGTEEICGAEKRLDGQSTRPIAS